MHIRNNYRFARLVIGDPDRALRASLQAGLFNAGFRDIVQARDTAALREAVDNESIDLIMVDLQIPSTDVTTVVQQIRRGLIGRNPYCLIVALATDPTAEKLKQIACAGVDGVLVRPHTTTALTRHLHRLVHNRKPFVLTDTYFGPNLRIAPRCDGTDETHQVEVPNTLRAKFVDGVSSERAIAMVKDTHGRIKDAHGRVRQRRGESQLIAVAEAIRNVLALTDSRDHGEYVEAVGRLEQIASQMHLRHAVLPKTTPNELAVNLARLIRTGIAGANDDYRADVTTLKMAAVHLANAQKAFQVDRVQIPA